MPYSVESPITLTIGCESPLKWPDDLVSGIVCVDVSTSSVSMMEAVVDNSRCICWEAPVSEYATTGESGVFGGPEFHCDTRLRSLVGKCGEDSPAGLMQC